MVDCPVSSVPLLAAVAEEEAFLALVLVAEESLAFPARTVAVCQASQALLAEALVPLAVEPAVHDAPTSIE